MVDKEYVLNVAKNKSAKSFIIRDPKGDVVFVSDTPAALNDRLAELDGWLNANSGIYRVELRSEAGKGLYANVNTRQRILIAEMEVMLDRDKPNKIGALYHFGGSPTLETIRSYEREIRELSATNARLEGKIQMMEFEAQHKQREHERELAAAKDPQKQIGSHISQLASVFGPGLMGGGNDKPIHGVESETEEISDDVSDQDAKTRLANAVNEIYIHDPNAVVNLEKLAKLVSAKPDIYSMAVGMIDNYI